MPRRATLPGADLLFGAPSQLEQRRQEEVSPPRHPAVDEPAASPVSPAPTSDEPAQKREANPAAAAGAQVEPSSGHSTRPRHEQKITFYCTDSDLTRLESARLSLRANHRLASDRGRIIRAAIAELLDDFDARGAESSLVKRLSAE